MSTMASTAPTSWKWTSSGEWPCTLPSASASLRKIPSAVRFTCFGELGAADHLQDLRQTPVMRVVRLLEDHPDVRRLDVSGGLPADLDPVPADAEAGEPFLEQLRIRPRADERPERHVAADPRETVEIGDSHRFTRCAKYPAPKPLSMFMTATPAAQELSIARSAASPPKLAP